MIGEIALDIIKGIAIGVTFEIVKEIFYEKE